MWRFSNLLIIFAVTSCVNSEYFEACLEVQEDTYIPLKDDCHSYIYCSENEEDSFKDECPKGTYFEANSLECVVDEHNMCPSWDTDNVEAIDDNHNEIIDTHKEDLVTPAEELSVPLATTTATTPLSSTASGYVDSIQLTTPRPVCDRNVDTFYPHYERCEYYYKCVAGYLTILRCNFYYAWDYHKQMCVPKTEVECYANSKLKTSL